MKPGHSYDFYSKAKIALSNPRSGTTTKELLTAEDAKDAEENQYLNKGTLRRRGGNVEKIMGRGENTI